MKVNPITDWWETLWSPTKHHWCQNEFGPSTIDVIKAKSITVFFSNVGETDKLWKTFSTLSHISPWDRSPESDELSLTQMQFWDEHARDGEGGRYNRTLVDCVVSRHTVYHVHYLFLNNLLHINQCSSRGKCSEIMERHARDTHGHGVHS